MENLIPVELIFHPSWWNKNCGISFEKEFFYDPKYRVESELKMDKYLYERFGDLGLGRKEAISRPVIGPVHIAAGFVISQLFGCKVKFHESSPPDVIARNLNDTEIMNLSAPNFKEAYPINELIKMMDILEEKFGYIEGDFNWSGIQNIALDLRGQQLFIDYFENPHIVKHLFDVISKTLVRFVKYITARTGTSSLSVNPSVRNFKPSVNLHSNCSVTMISAKTYEEYLLKYERYLSQNLQPYGIHHCGNNMHRFAGSYAKVGGVCFYDVGWGSDVKECRKMLPDEFLNLRLSPVRILNCTPSEVEEDTIKLVADNGKMKNIGLCCINMDSDTPDENIRRIFNAVEYLKNNKTIKHVL
jgi:uroporphyrinogen-III decarboxylase